MICSARLRRPALRRQAGCSRLYGGGLSAEVISRTNKYCLLYLLLVVLFNYKLPLLLLVVLLLLLLLLLIFVVVVVVVVVVVMLTIIVATIDYLIGFTAVASAPPTKMVNLLDMVVISMMFV